MSDVNFTKYKTERERKIIYNPRSGLEMEAATLHRTPIHKYSDLCRMAEKHGAARMLAHMFRGGDTHIILLQDPSDMNSGHWISVSRNLPKKQIYFFSTYGGKPDIEKMKWISEDDLIESGQIMNIFMDGLRDAQKHGWEIHFNDYPYQKNNDKTAFCGIMTVAFLRSGGDPDKFKKQTLQLARTGINPVVYYYDKYFM